MSVRAVGATQPPMQGNDDYHDAKPRQSAQPSLALPANKLSRGSSWLFVPETLF